MKVCVKCGINKNDSDFSIQSGIRRDGTKDRNPRLCSWCRKCSSLAATESAKRRRAEAPNAQREKDRLWYRRNKKRINANTNKRVKKYKQDCIDYLGGSCKICGYKKCIAVLDFHHRDPESKEFEISRQTPKINNRIKKELDKCDLLCSNCHKELHYNENNGG